MFIRSASLSVSRNTLKGRICLDSRRTLRLHAGFVGFSCSKILGIKSFQRANLSNIQLGSQLDSVLWHNGGVVLVGTEKTRFIVPCFFFILFFGFSFC
jgi:hypothetical protein